MKKRALLIIVLIFMFAHTAKQKNVYAKEEPIDKEIPAAPLHNGKLIAQNTVVAIGPANALPSTISNGLFQLDALNTTIFPDAKQQITLYQVSPNTNEKVNYETVIQFLETTVSGSCVDLNYVHGSPNILGSGSQYNIENAANQDQQAFDDQWAWSQINYFDAGGGQLSPYKGEKVVVAVLDAFQEYEGGAINSADLWNDPAITYHTPATLPPTDASSPSMAYHGDMILSMAREIAPESEYMAVRALNSQGFGYTYSIVQALDYVLTTVGAMQDYDLVINMSFGAEMPDRCGIIEQLLNAGKKQMNVVYVAASGNDNVAGGTAPQPEFPARFETVLAIAASDRSEQMASYSNIGDFMAPGGDEAYPGANHCEDTEQGVIGRIPTPGGMLNVVSCGTSFSAGFVSGLAAATFSGHLDNADSVTTAIVNGAQQNNQIIDAAYTLNQ